MVYRTTLCAIAFVSCLSLSAPAMSEGARDPSISGPANGSDVVPSSAVQKQIEGRSIYDIVNGQPSATMGSALAAGAPGVEGAPGGPSGRNLER